MTYYIIIYFYIFIPILVLIHLETFIFQNQQMQKQEQTLVKKSEKQKKQKDQEFKGFLDSDQDSIQQYCQSYQGQSQGQDNTQEQKNLFVQGTKVMTKVKDTFEKQISRFTQSEELKGFAFKLILKLKLMSIQVREQITSVNQQKQQPLQVKVEKSSMQQKEIQAAPQDISMKQSINNDQQDQKDQIKHKPTKAEQIAKKDISALFNNINPSIPLKLIQQLLDAFQHQINQINYEKETFYLKFYHQIKCGLIHFLSSEQLIQKFFDNQIFKNMIEYLEFFILIGNIPISAQSIKHIIYQVARQKLQQIKIDVLELMQRFQARIFDGGLKGEKRKLQFNQMKQDTDMSWPLILNDQNMINQFFTENMHQNFGLTNYFRCYKCDRLEWRYERFQKLSFRCYNCLEINEQISLCRVTIFTLKLLENTVPQEIALEQAEYIYKIRLIQHKEDYEKFKAFIKYWLDNYPKKQANELIE